MVVRFSFAVEKGPAASAAVRTPAPKTTKTKTTKTG
jgi:hypothetical protein